MLGPVEFEVRTPPADLRAHVAHALSLGLPPVPWQFSKGSRRAPKTLTIIANGPSARLAPLGAPATLALNGALKLFTDQGLAPTYWACCDPQRLCADFLSDAPKETIYLVASKCHPAVFEALEGRRVFLWHVDDAESWALTREHEPVMCAVSITIVALELMRRIGFRRFETWGWDGCFQDGRAHATDQGGYPSEITVTVGKRDFHTTTAWALEAQDAMTKFRLASTQTGLDLIIHGDGMLAAIRDYRHA